MADQDPIQEYARQLQKEHRQALQEQRRQGKTSGKTGLQSGIHPDIEKAMGKEAKKTGLGFYNPKTGNMSPGIRRELAKQKREKEKIEKAKKLAKIRSKIKEAGGVKKATENLGKGLTASILKFSWLNVISTYGLTLLYINFHFIAKYMVNSNYFVDFGKEWMYEIEKTSKVKAKGGSTAAKLGEIILLFIADLLLALIIIILLIALLLPIIAVAMAISFLMAKLGL